MPDVPDQRLSTLTEPVSILMPVYNEPDIIQSVIEEWHQEVITFLPSGSELLFDDASNDRTTQILYNLKKRYPYIQIHHTERDGFGNAAKRLYIRAKNPLVFFTDSDGQHLPEDFWVLAKAMRTSDIDGYDMLHGYKVNRKHPYYQIVGSALFNAFVRFLFSSEGRDINSSFKLIKRSLVQDQVPKLAYVPNFINSELYIRAEKAGYRIHNIPVGHRARYIGESKVSTPVSYFRHGLQSVYGLLALKKNMGKNAYNVSP